MPSEITIPIRLISVHHLDSTLYSQTVWANRPNVESNFRYNSVYVLKVHLKWSCCCVHSNWSCSRVHSNEVYTILRVS